MINTSGPVRIQPRDLKIIEKIPGIVGVARDADLKLIWCTSTFFRVTLSVDTVEDMMGSDLDDILTSSAAKERAKIHHHVMQTGEVESHFQFSRDTRVLCTIFPLDEDAFGHKGVLAVIKDAPADARLMVDKEIPVLSTPNLYELNALTSRELEILHFIAKGLSTNDIAKIQHRSARTVENQINSIHAKLGTHSRAELVRFSSERGIQSFSDEQWLTIVDGARTVRKEHKRERQEEIDRARELDDQDEQS